MVTPLMNVPFLRQITKPPSFLRVGQWDLGKFSTQYVHVYLFLHFLPFHFRRKFLMHGEPTCRKNPTLCSSFLLGFLIVFLLSFRHGCCKSDIHTGYRLTLAVPVEYTVGFIGRAFLIESNQMAPNFKTALSVEAVNGKYSCSLQVFLGDVKVWNSGHYSHFYVSEKCVLELTQAGDLKLKGPKNRVGWRTGTSRQGVEVILKLVIFFS